MIEPVLNYTGSKFKLLEQLLPEFDYTKKYFVDLFAGGGSVFINVLDKYKKILVNDIIADLIGIHEKLFTNPENLISTTKKLATCKEDQEKYNKLREDYNNSPTPEKLYALMLSCTNNMMRFNKKFKFNQTWGKRGWSEKTDKKIEAFLNHTKQYKDKILFTATHFNNIKLSKPSMIYIDSPYTNSEAGYNNYWEKNDDNILYKYCKKADDDGHSFVLSGILGKHKDDKRWELIDKLIADGYNYKILENDYEKVARKKKSKDSDEIIIKNF